MKSPYLWAVVLGVWLLCIATLQRPLIEFLLTPLSFPQRASLLLFISWVDYAWLYCIYQLVLICFSAVAPRGGRRLDASPRDVSPVAVLYTTMNDFSERAALSCVSQEYPSFHVFLLDDSTEPRCRSQVDAFRARFPATTTVIRRADRQGFKAGNLNHVLRLISADYEFFAVCDADGILPPDFIRRTLEHFAGDDRVGFVQTRQRVIASPDSAPFANDLSVSLEMYWELITPPAQRFGFVMFHGHGGIIRSRVWSEIGGFPALVAEDLAFSTRAREHGYVGVYADNVVCEEEFPQSYEAFAKRQLKYTRGAVEHLRKGMWSFLRSPEVAWFEKADRLMSSLAMVSAFPFLIFLLNFALVLPLVFPAQAGQTYGEGVVPVWGLLQMERSVPVFTWPSYFMTVSTLLAPLVPAAYHLRKNPAKLVRYVAASVAVHLSLILMQSRDILLLAATGRNFFPATGDRAGHRAPKPRGRAAGVRALKSVPALGALTLSALVIASASLGLIPICFAVGVGLLADKLEWNHGVLRAAVLLPMTAIILLVVCCCSEAVALCGSTSIVITSGF